MTRAWVKDDKDQEEKRSDDRRKSSVKNPVKFKMTETDTDQFSKM